MVSLRDGRKLIGVLRSWDQFGTYKAAPLLISLAEALHNGCLANPEPNCGAGNLVLQDTIERLFAQSLYADINRGVYLVRGENIVIMGEIVRWITPPHVLLLCPFLHPIRAHRHFHGMLTSYRCAS